MSEPTEGIAENLEFTDAMIALIYSGHKTMTRRRFDKHMPPGWVFEFPDGSRCEVVAERTEPLHSISESDAIAEGAVEWWNAMTRRQQEEIYSGGRGPQGMFMDLWKSIYGAAEWDKNPVVHVYEFKRTPCA